ncbi:MAG: hypothetical protein GXP52_05140 [Deltaproteobacteria bacterium]|nr:hypothetical protein [Deltaproteobacteria bacterium]
MRTLYYFAVIARSIEGDESDAAIPGGAEKPAPSGRYGIASHRLQLAMTDGGIRFAMTNGGV